MERTYAVIDLKSFYASVECVEKGKDPFTHPLVVADTSRGTNAICLAVSPYLKTFGIPGRVRIKDIPPSLKYEVAVPRMNLYMEKSAEVYEIYLKYISEKDIHIYSIDECFLDYTDYLSYYKKNAKELTQIILDDILKTLGLTATAGIGPNLFLCKIALDILAKHEKSGIAILDENSFKEKLWKHEPITDIWRIGPGTAKRLLKYGARNLYDVSKLNEEILYNEFGKNALFLIDHSHGRESCTIKDIKDYSPKSMSLSNSQILFRDYTKEEALTILIEMVDKLVLELVELNLETLVIALFVKNTRTEENIVSKSEKLDIKTNSFNKLKNYFSKLFLEIVPSDAKVRQIGISMGELSYEGLEQLNIFSNEEKNIKEKKAQKAAIAIKERFGKNALIHATSLRKEATGIERNKMVGGHKG